MALYMSAVLFQTNYKFPKEIKRAIVSISLTNPLSPLMSQFWALVDSWERYATRRVLLPQLIPWESSTPGVKSKPYSLNTFEIFVFDCIRVP